MWRFCTVRLCRKKLEGTPLRAQLQFLFSPDADPIQDYEPEDPERFGVLVEAMIGPEGSEDYESFDFMVCSPVWLRDELREQQAVFGHGFLFLARYSYPAIVSAITALYCFLLKLS